MTRLETLIPIPSLQGADIELPADIERLYDLAYNLWWTWNPQVRQLFSAIDSASWSRYRNPVELLINVDHSHWESLVENDTFMQGYTEWGKTIPMPARYRTPNVRNWYRNEV